MLVFWFSWGIGVEVGHGQSSAAPAYKATFSWSLAADATVVRASTNTQVTCTVDISLTGDSYQPLPAWVMLARTTVASAARLQENVAL